MLIFGNVIDILSELEVYYTCYYRQYTITLVIQFHFFLTYPSKVDKVQIYQVLGYKQ